MAKVVEGLITGIGFIGGGAILETGYDCSGHRDRREFMGHRRHRGFSWTLAATTSQLQLQFSRF